MNYVLYTIVVMSLTANIKLEPMNKKYKSPVVQTSSPTSSAPHIATFQEILLESTQTIQTIIEENNSPIIAKKFTQKTLYILKNLQTLHLYTYNKVLKKPSKFEKELTEHCQISQEIVKIAKKSYNQGEITEKSATKLEDLDGKLNRLKSSITTIPTSKQNIYIHTSMGAKL